MKLVVRSH